MIRSLHLRLRPMPLEPAHGVLSRLAGRHGVNAVPRFAASLGLVWRDVMAGGHVEAIAIRAGIDPAALIACSPTVHPGTRTVSLAGETIALGDWSVTGRRVCPSCVAGDMAIAAASDRPGDWVVAHRLHLDVRSIRRCPTHRVPLLNACPGCGTALRWSQAPLARCPSGCELASFAAYGDLDVGFDAYLAGRLGFGAGLVVHVLDGLPFRRAVQFCERVGRLAVLGWKPRVGRQNADDDDVCRRAGFAMAVAWPDSITPVLDRILERSGSAGDEIGKGLFARYGWVHLDWLSVDDDEVSALVRPLVRAHAVANAIVASDEPILAHVAPPTVSLTAAAHSVRMSVERTRRVLDDAGVVPEGSRRGVAFAMDPEAVGATLQTFGGATVTRSEAGRALGLGRSRVGDLLEAGLLDRSGGRVTAESISALRRLLLDACASSPAPDRTTPLVDACRGRGVPVVDALARIASGRLRAWPEQGPADTLSLLVCPKDLGPPRRTLTRVAAARKVRIHPQCVGELVVIGAVATASDGGIDASSLTGFIDRFVAASELAVLRGRSPRVVIAELGKAGVNPAFGPPAFRQTLYCRASLPKWVRAVRT